MLMILWKFSNKLISTCSYNSETDRLLSISLKLEILSAGALLSTKCSKTFTQTYILVSKKKLIRIQILWNWFMEKMRRLQIYNAHLRIGKLTNIVWEVLKVHLKRHRNKARMLVSLLRRMTIKSCLAAKKRLFLRRRSKQFHSHQSKVNQIVWLMINL